MGNCCSDSFNFKDFNDNKDILDIIKDYNEKNKEIVEEKNKEKNKEIVEEKNKEKNKEIIEEKNKEIVEEKNKEIVEEIKYGFSRKNCIYIK